MWSGSEHSSIAHKREEAIHVPRVDGWINKMCYHYSLEYYSPLKGRNSDPHCRITNPEDTKPAVKQQL